MRLPVVVALLLLIAACGSASPAYDETAHRAAVENLLGHPVADWSAVRDVARENCDADDAPLRATLTLAASEDPQQYEVMAIGVQHMCPGRDNIVHEVDQVLPR